MISDTEAISRIVTRLKSLKHRSKNPRAGYPLWSVVSRLFSCGSTSATEWCIARGLDPHMRAKEWRL
jgi:hypothetical protein